MVNISKVTVRLAVVHYGISGGLINISQRNHKHFTVLFAKFYLEARLFYWRELKSRHQGVDS